MIHVIERNPNYSSKLKRYIVTCYKCESRFECDSLDFHRVQVTHGMTDNGVTCPVCGRDCHGWYGTDKFLQLED